MTPEDQEKVAYLKSKGWRFGGQYNGVNYYIPPSRIMICRLKTPGLTLFDADILQHAMDQIELEDKSRD